MAVLPRARGSAASGRKDHEDKSCESSPCAAGELEALPADPGAAGTTTPNNTPARQSRRLSRWRSAAGRQLLQRPLVAVRVGEEDEPAPVEVLDVADVGAAREELRVRGLDVRDNHLQAAHAPRRALDDAPADRDRAGRSWR